MIFIEDGSTVFLNSVGTHLPDYLGGTAQKATQLAMAWLKQLVATLATWSLRFSPTSAHLRFVVEEVSVKQVLLHSHSLVYY